MSHFAVLAAEVLDLWKISVIELVSSYFPCLDEM